MGTRQSDLEKIIRGLEDQGVVVRRNRKLGYTLKFPDGSVDTISASSDPKAIVSQKTMVKRHGLHWPLDPLPIPRKRPTKKAEAEAPVEEKPATKAPARKAAPASDIPSTIGTGSADMAVTPEIAEAWLDFNKKNRRISELNVEKYAGFMRDGSWHYDAEPIRFDKNGDLIDGQHRLWAVIESGTTQRFLVVRGLEERAFVTIDTGKTRTFADLISIEHPDVAQLTTTAAVTRMIFLWERGVRGKALATSHGAASRMIANETILNFFTENKDALVSIARRAHTMAQRIPSMTATMLGLLFWVFEDIDVDDSEDFFERLASGADLDENHPILALRRFLYRWSEGKNVRSGLPVDVGVAVAIKAWNAYRAGRDIKVMTYRPGGSSPEVFPIPE